MPQKSDQELLSDLADMLTGSGDKVQWEAELKPWLEDLIESKASKAQVGYIPISASEDTQFDMPAQSKIVAIHAKNTTNDTQDIAIGTTNGGTEVAEISIPPQEHLSIDIGRFDWDARTIYLAGINGPVEFLIDVKING